MKKFKSFLAMIVVCAFLASGVTVNAVVAGVNETEDASLAEFDELECQVVANTITVRGKTPVAETLVTFWAQENTDVPKNLFVHAVKSDQLGEFSVKFIMNPSIYDADGTYDATLRVGGTKLNIQRIDAIPLYSQTEMNGCKSAFATITDATSFEAFFTEYSDMLGVEGYSAEDLEILYAYYQVNPPTGDESLEEIIDILATLGDKLTRHKTLVENVSGAAIRGDASEVKRLLSSDNYKDLFADMGYDFDASKVIKEADMWARMLTEEGYASLEEIQDAFIAARDAQLELDKEFGGAVTDDREKNFMDIWKVSNVANLITVSGGLEETVTTQITIHVSGLETGVSDESEKIIAFLYGKATKPEPTADHVEFNVSFPLNTARFGDEVTGRMRIGAENTNIHQFYVNLYSQDAVDAMIDEFKSISDAEELNDFIENNKTMLEMTGNFSDEKLDVMYELYAERDYSEVEDSETLAKEIVSLETVTDEVLDFLDALNNASKSKRWGKVLEVIETKYKDLGDSSTTYGELLDATDDAKKLGSVMGVYRRLLGKEFASLSEVLEAFLEAVEAQKDEEAAAAKKPSNNGGGGGGGGFGGGAVIEEIFVGGEVIEEEVIELPKEDLPAAPFTDIAGYDWAASAINGLRQQNIIHGDGSGTYRPGATMTREEYLSVLLKTFGVEIESGDVPFGDVDKNAWYADVVATAYKLGITNGMGDGRFGIGENIIRADMVVLAERLAKELGVIIEKKEAAVIFADYTKIPTYAYDAVVSFQQADFINGDENKNFNPTEKTTRAEAAVFFWNIYGAVK